MARKQAAIDAPGWGKWKIRLSLAVGAVAVIGACLAIRTLWGPGSASAQPSPSADSVSRPPRTTPAPRDAAATPFESTADVSGQTINVLAVVNGEKFTREQLAQECLRRYGNDVLETMINKQLILNACQQLRIVITRKDIDDEIKRMADKFGMSADRFLEMLREERDIVPDQYARDIIWPTLALRRLAADQIQVSHEEIDQAIESELGPAVRVRMITVGKREEAERLHALAVANPEDFGRLAKDHSEDKTSAAARGWIPPIRRHLGEPKIEQAAFSLAEGEISPIVQVANQFVIMKCEKHVEAARLNPQFRKQAEERIIEHLREKKLRSAAETMFSQLQSRVKVVNVYNDAKLRQQMPGVAATIDGTPITIRTLSEECITRHGRDVLDGEINRLLLTQELRRKELRVENADIDAEIARAADSYGYWTKDGAPDINRWLKDVTEKDGATIDLYVRDAVWPTVALKKIVGGRFEVSQQDLERGFEANYGERVEVLAIFLNDQRQAEKVWDMARENPTPERFGELASQFSIEPRSRAYYGKIPPIQKHGGEPAIEKEAFGLQPGELSGLISTGDTWVIMYCLGRTEPVVQDFDAVRDELYKDIHEKKLRLAMAQKFDELRESAQIDNFLAGTSQAGRRTSAPPATGTQLGGRVPFARPSGTDASSANRLSPPRR